ncbi:MAG TPA: hypothetical protein VMU54_04395 [Planctomycetota bacterium]|nr:hypothetical protein [Planctomycetota bacterium]
MMVVLFWILGLILGPPVHPEVRKDDVRKLLIAHASDGVIIAYIQKNAPAVLLSTQDILDLRAQGASDAVISAFLAAAGPGGNAPRPAAELEIPVGPDYILESPEYYPYYYDYYPNYTPYFYTYPGFSYYFYWPYFYHQHRYFVRPFPYYGHEGWRYHHTFPYHSGNWGYHPWYDHQGFGGYHPQGGTPRGGVIRGGGGGTRGSGHH